MVLSALTTLMNDTTSGRFQAWTTAPNATRDENAYNDTLTTRFAPSITLPFAITVSMVTNNTRSQSFSNETSWQIINVAGNMVGLRTNAANLTTDNDNLRLQPACNSLLVTDTGCDSFAWWASPLMGNNAHLRREQQLATGR